MDNQTTASGTITYKTAEEILHSNTAGIPIPETREEIHQYRKQIEKAMEQYADQFRITPAVEELEHIEAIIELVKPPVSPAELNNALSMMHTLKHILRHRIRK